MDERRTIIGDLLGDGEIIAALPGPLRGLGRKIGDLVPHARRRRLERALKRLFPRLAFLETRLMDGSALLLQDLSADEALTSPECAERGWQVFQKAWHGGMIFLKDLDGEAIAPGKNGLETACCGLSMKEIEANLVALTAQHLFAGNESGLEKIGDALGGIDTLPKLRVLAELDALRLEVFKGALGPLFGQILVGLPLDRLQALALLKPHALHSLRKSMGREFIQVTEWDAEVLIALAESFVVVEQYSDLGPYVTSLPSAEHIRVIGNWETRDITERVNQERLKQGKQRLKGRRFETDIAIVMHVFGTHVEALLERPPEFVDVMGRLAAKTAQLKGLERKERMDQIETFASRYMEYMTVEMAKALRLSVDNPMLTGAPEADPLQNPSFAEIIGILDGLWNKKDLGRPFFEGNFQKPPGFKAVAGLIANFLDMKRRGSVKGEEVDKILATTQLLDASLRSVYIRSF
ncbi:hypothetical protein [Pararhodospirillum photometricum]|uniref:Uncharacterized protein n=1 Tax=Pararhodospirillum photometricum DSM 122 TaxID=1150469 RepID=H6SMT8_PARPM|nr:hypothetical protein [Pararhodospirillum photometricum]CCG09223.1 Putative uncharacterized protein [Pararhodospirillum photometricum DSM 122]